MACRFRRCGEEKTTRSNRMNFRLATSTIERLLEVPYLPPIPGSTPGDYNLDQLPKYPWCQRFLFSYLSKLISAAKSMSSKAVTLASHQEKKALRTRVTGVTSLMSIQILDHNNYLTKPFLELVYILCCFHYSERWLQSDMALWWVQWAFSLSNNERLRGIL